MLTRLWVDNFRSFVNFDLNLGDRQLIIGLNGSGKSTLLQVLNSLKRLIINGDNPEDLFPESTLTKWHGSQRQGFELEVKIDGSVYLFRLELGRGGPAAKARIDREKVLCDGRPLFDFTRGEVHLFNDFFEDKVQYPFDPFKSALATIRPRQENTRLTKFKTWVENLCCVQINPHAINSRSESEEPELPEFDFANFASWYRHMSQERGDRTEVLRNHLKEIIPGFTSLDSTFAGGRVRILKARFQGESSTDYSLNFTELSDGQRALICLYSLLDFLVDRGTCLAIDEPENFIAIPEIQPWLIELLDRIEEVGGQVILTSHHPEVVNYLAPELGIILERDGPGPVRVRPYSDTGMLAPAEAIARGWTGS